MRDSNTIAAIQRVKNRIKIRSVKQSLLFTAKERFAAALWVLLKREPKQIKVYKPFKRS
jgi:hypothetical protein